MKKIILNLPKTEPDNGFFLNNNILCYKEIKEDVVNINNFCAISSFFDGTTAETFIIEWPESTSIATEKWGFNNVD